MVEGFIKFIKTETFIGAAHAKPFFRCDNAIELFFLSKLQGLDKRVVLYQQNFIFASQNDQNGIFGSGLP